MSSIHPSRIRPTGEKLVVKRYERPAMARGLHLPDAFSTDTSGTLWEVVTWSKKAMQYLGFPPREGDIVKTRPGYPPSAGLEDERDGRALFFLNADQVMSVVSWVPDSEEEVENHD